MAGESFDDGGRCDGAAGAASVSAGVGASEHAVRLMADTVGGRLGVKASGGIRTTADALAMVAAGATRLGCSASRAILDGCVDPEVAS